MMSNRARHDLVMLVLFVMSRIGYRLLGVTFDMSPLRYFDQLLDPALLRDRLGESLLYLHSQPPLFNLIVGLALRLSPSHAGTVLHLFFCCCGLAMALALRRLAVAHGVRERTALIIATLFMVSSSAICHENLLFYTYLIALLLTLVPLLLHRFVVSGRWLHGCLAFSALALVMLMRSSYHPVLLLAIVGVMIRLRPRFWRRTLVSALPAATAVLALYVKNLILFGTFTGSTWLGATIHVMTTGQIPMDERTRLIARGELTPYARIDDPFAPLDTFRRIMPVRTEPTGIPALDQEMKSTGAPNNNHLAYIGISRAYGENARRVILSRPMVYASAVARSFVVYASPETNVWLVERNRERIAAIDQIFALLQGQCFYTERWSGSAADLETRIARFFHTGLFVLVGLPVAICWGARRALRRWRMGRGDRATSLAVMVMIMFYSMSVSTLLSIGENSRYRFEITPMLLVILAMLGSDIAARRRARQVRRRPGPLRSGMHARMAPIRRLME